MASERAEFNYAPPTWHSFGHFGGGDHNPLTDINNKKYIIEKNSGLPTHRNKIASILYNPDPKMKQHLKHARHTRNDRTWQTTTANNNNE